MLQNRSDYARGRRGGTPRLGQNATLLSIVRPGTRGPSPGTRVAYLFGMEDQESTEEVSNYVAAPSSHFVKPANVRRAAGLSRKDKLRILRAWADEEQQRLNASDENMTGGPPSRLRNVLEQIRILSAAPVFEFRRILCPTDFSELSQRGLRLARSLARGSSTIQLLHVSDEPVDGERDTRLSTVSMESGVPNFHSVAVDSGSRAANARLTEHLAMHRDAALLHIKGGRSQLFESICTVAEAGGFDLIAMATHQRTGLSHFWWGSQTEAVLRAAPCPVLSCGADDDGTASLNPVKRILCPIDLSTASKVALDKALMLAGRDGAPVDVLHCYELPTSVTGASAVQPRVVRDVRDAARKKLRGLLDSLSANERRMIDDVRVEMGSAKHLIARADERNEYDLIVLGARDRSAISEVLIGSVAQSVVQTASSPVLVVPEQTDRAGVPEPKAEPTVAGLRLPANMVPAM